MKQNKSKLILLLLVLFVSINSLTYYITEKNKSERINLALQDNLKDLQTHYKILLHNQSIAADAAYYSTTLFMKEFIPLMTKVHTATPAEKKVLRKKLYDYLKVKYEILKTQGVLQFHFVLPNNISFLRMHKPDKFGDDLTQVREDFRYVNSTRKAIKGFTQGRTAHGFRNTYPIFAKDGTYLGAMEVSFSSDSFQEYLTNISNIHTHFLVNKKIFTSNAWKRDDLILEYTQSAEHKDYMLTLNGIHSKQKCVVNNRIHFKDKRDEINRGIKNEEQFSVYTVIDSKYVIVASFFPIKNIQHTKTLAWLVSYENSPFIFSTIEGTYITQLVMFMLFLTLTYLSYLLLMTKHNIEQEHKRLNDVLNATDDIMLMTNFNNVTFSNRKFKDFFGVDDEQEFNEKHTKLLDLLIEEEGYLHKNLTKENETFIQLIKRTQEEERVILVLDKHLSPKSFNIAISRTTDSDDNSYLITLTDITKLKEKESTIQKKAYIDGLTGVFNRNKFNEVFDREFNRSLRHKSTLSVAIVDLDHFKNFNDEYGHLIGDEVLIIVAQHLKKNVRNTDILARWGGEEFVILFPQTPKEEVEFICNKLRVGIEKLSHETAGGITASFGVTQYRENDTAETMFKRCDEALYLAKERGRNMVCVKAS